MKILFFSTSLNGGGAERIIQLLSDYLLSKGHQIIISVLDHGTPAYTFPQEAKVLYFKTGLFNRGIFKILFIPLQMLELLGLIKKEKPDVTISFLVRANLVNALSKSLNSKRSVILSHRNITQGLYGKPDIKSRIMLLLIRQLYNRADRIIAISKDVKISLEVLGVDSRKITIISNFISPAMIRRSNQAVYSIPEDKPIIVSMGRLIEQKDFPTLLKAFAKVRSVVDARLAIIGDGPLRSRLTELAAELNIAEDVLFTGWIDHPFELLRKSNVFVLCSVYEGFGNVILEAMACGLPVICTNCPGGPGEILDHDRYGKLVAIGDFEQIADCIIHVLRHPEVSNHMKRLSLTRVKAYNVEKLAPHYLQIFESYRQTESRVFCLPADRGLACQGNIANDTDLYMENDIRSDDRPNAKALPN